MGLAEAKGLVDGAPKMIKEGVKKEEAESMKKKIEELESEIVEVRREDKTIKNFTIPSQKDIGGVILQLDSVAVAKNHKFINKKVNITLNKHERLLLTGPNGIGKTTLLEKLALWHVPPQRDPALGGREGKPFLPRESRSFAT